mmetsp:Transcript_15989/g.15397  ORF Transcript_15989/g.15397 Transcript_15989/m.15397 type:complete len:85 (-) Transcript_15989:346-600(-)
MPFKPNINDNSKRIMAKKRPQGTVADILIQRKQEFDSRIRELQQEKENQELVGCTFHPKILQSPMSSGNHSNRSRVCSTNYIPP